MGCWYGLQNHCWIMPCKVKHFRFSFSSVEKLNMIKYFVLHKWFHFDQIMPIHIKTESTVVRYINLQNDVDSKQRTNLQMHSIFFCNITSSLIGHQAYMTATGIYFYGGWVKSVSPCYLILNHDDFKTEHNQVKWKYTL